MTHPQYPIPQDEEGRKRYESAKRHAALAKEQGKSLDEIHEIFKKVMNGTGKCSGRKEEAVSKCHGHYPCLLYTSPSPRDGLLSRMPSSA